MSDLSMERDSEYIDILLGYHLKELIPDRPSVQPLTLRNAVIELHKIHNKDIEKLAFHTGIPAEVLNGYLRSKTDDKTHL